MSVKQVLVLLVVLTIAVLGPAWQAQPARADDGWYTEMFSNQSLAGWPAHTRTDRWIGFDWGDAAPVPGMSSEYFSIRWTRSWSLKVNGVFQFCAIADDGARIWVEDTLVLDEWHANNGIAYCGEYWAETGDYDVKVEYYEHGGNALIYVWWDPH